MPSSEQKSTGPAKLAGCDQAGDERAGAGGEDDAALCVEPSLQNSEEGARRHANADAAAGSVCVERSAISPTAARICGA